MIKYVVFDFDGTLVDSKAVFIELYNAMAKREGYKLMTPENIEHLRTLSISERCSYLKMPLYKIPFVAAKFLKQYKASIHLLKFNEGIDAMLSGLLGDEIPLAVLSSNSAKNIDTFFKQSGIDINDIYCSSNIFGKDKVLKKFLAQKKLKPSEILYIGDESRDIIACRKLGIEIAWVSWGYDSIEAISDCPPDHVIHSTDELLKLIHQKTT